MKRHTFKTIAQFAVTAAVTILLILLCAKVTERKESRQNYAGLFEHGKDVEVLFVGTSHVINGINPLEIYREYGITSYNLGTHGVQQTVQYWTLINALHYCAPKVVVIDCFAIDDSVKVYDDAYSWVHAAIDAFPLSQDKIRAARDITSDLDPNVGSAADLIFSYNTYHNRWSELGEEDIRPMLNANRQMGADMKKAYTPCYDQDYDASPIVGEETNNIRYLRKMIEECQSRDIKVILMFLPCYAEEAEYKAANTAGQIADEYGIDYYNFLDTDLTDYATDFADEGDHLNPLGAKRISLFMGEQLVSTGAVADRQGEPGLNYWDDMISEYDSDIDDILRNTEDAQIYLMLLQASGHKIRLSWKDDEIKESYRYGALLSGMGIDLDSIEPGDTVNLICGESETAEYSQDEDTEETEDIRITVYNDSGEIIDIADIDYVHALSGVDEDSYCTITHGLP